MKISDPFFKKNGLGIKGKKPGFTLVEVLVSTAILTFILASLYGVLNVGRFTFGADTRILDLQQDARLAMDWMVREIRQAFPGSRGPMPLVDSNTINFNTFLIQNITYSHNSNANQIIRNQPLDPIPARIIANNIEAITFTYSDDDITDNRRGILTIALTARHPPRPDLPDASVALTEQVRLRNE